METSGNQSGNQSFADIEAGKIVLRAPFANLLLCKRIPGAWWDAARKAWTYPATPQHAALVRATIPRLSASERFTALVATKPTPTPANVPCLPAGLKTRPWRHQIAAYQFAMERFENGSPGVLLAMGMGCVAGDAELIINRGGCARRMRLRDLHHKFHGGQSSGRRWNPLMPCYTRSLIDGEIRLNRILKVLAQGRRPVLRITLASGKSLRVTADHQIAAGDGGWVEAAKLMPGDMVLTNGLPACRICGGTQRVVSYRYAKHVGLCRSCIGRMRRTKHWVVDKDGYVRLYGMDRHPRANAAGQVYEHIVVMEQVLGRPIGPEEHVHHKNGVKHDNRPENLEVLPAREHHRAHGARGGYLHLDGGKMHFLPKPDRVVSVEPDGETDVYDLQMQAPGHNFVANGILVHNCGKSLAAGMILLGLEARRTLVCCPLRVIQVWTAQFQRHLSTPMIVVALDEDAGSVADKQRLAEEKLRLAETTGVPFVAVINYDSVWREPFGIWAERQAWDLVVADESHKLKHPGGKASLYFKRLRGRARRRLALTGTPMPHSPLDVYAQFRFLDTSIFGPSFNAFKQKYAVMGGFQNKQVTSYKNLDELEALMRRVTFRVGKDILDLPPETHVTYRSTLSPECQAIYRSVEEDFIAEVEGGTITVANAMVALLRLQQITGGWVKTDDERYRRVDWSKQRLLEDTLEDIGAEEPVVVFCRFHADLDAVHEACASLSMTNLELSGRRDELARWQAGEAQVLAVQISAGGVGVDLSRARYSVYYSLSFSLGEYDQALSRVHRPGQTRPVEHIHLVARHTVDEKIMRALERRAEVIQAILAEINEGRS
ncbi:MAG: SNF2-related protein [Acidobacteriota bacterium]